MMSNVKCIKYNKKKSIGIIFTSLILLAFCVFFGFVDFRKFIDEPLFTNNIIYYSIRGFMIFASLFFAFGLLFLIKNILFFGNKVIEICDEFMIDRSSFIAGGKILYSEIDAIYIRGIFICIKLKDGKGFLKRQNVIKRILMILNKKMKYEYITISDTLLDTNLMEIQKIIGEKLKML